MVDAQEVLAEANAQRDREQNLLRPVAEFFHQHEGELFERYEAVDALIEADAVPETDERTLHRVVGNLCADRVDPVQNVVRDDAKYVGVLEYDEHEYWYEYTEVNDVHGRMNVGVCAQCVKDADNDGEVARGCGTTDELSKKISDHYDTQHTQDPSSVETGATLVSGTTVAGNTAAHTANDGLGSGIDADTIQGDNSTEFVNFGIVYDRSIINSVDIVAQFQTPCAKPRGINFDSNDSIWHDDNRADSIYQLNQSGSTITKFASPSFDPNGVGVDLSDSIWNVEGFVRDSIFQLDQNGTIISGFSSPSNLPQRIGFDSNDSIWHADAGTDSVYQLDQNGNVLSKFSSPSKDANGVGLNSNDSIWHSDVGLGAESIYKLDQNGTIISVFESPSTLPRGVGVDSNDSVWIVDEQAESVYQNLGFNKKIQYD